MDYSSGDSRNSSPNYISEEHEHEWPLYDPYYFYSNYEQVHEDEHDSPRKRIKFSYEDRITKLPDALITHILSLLPVDDILRTQLLSKQWRYAWASIPVLTFSRTGYYVNNTSNNEFITNTLMFHKGQLKSLSLFRIEGYNGFEPLTNLWVQCAVNKRIETLVLEVCGKSQIIVSSGSKLRNLVIKYGGKGQDDYGGDTSDKSLEISGPNIKSLEISGYLGWKDCRLEDVSSLVHVNFRFYISKGYNEDFDSYDSRVLKTIKHLLIRDVSHVEKLSLGTWCTQVLSLCELGGEPTIPLQCKTLEIVSLNERSIRGIARLLRSSYYLERLTIDTEPYRACHQAEDGFNGKNYWKSPERTAFMNPWQHHLKVVQFIGLFDQMESEYMVELAEYILDHANVLEKLVLKPSESAYGQQRRSRSRSSDFRHSSLFQVMQKLLGCPRSSLHARVLLV
ncbi:putative F-box/LRR-repeat protein At3g18150 [Silene latifolia]|uniref:putative F-box/LRR-repeat protein At3g18150 n=1 Tax=Silene latifolia TaxID=37657 RepID=UPI003D77C2A9